MCLEQKRSNRCLGGSLSLLPAFAGLVQPSFPQIGLGSPSLIVGTLLPSLVVQGAEAPRQIAYFSFMKPACLQPFAQASFSASVPWYGLFTYS